MSNEKSEEKKEPPKPMVAFRNDVKRMADDFKNALPPQISVEKFTRVLLTAVQQTPDLLFVNRNSLWNACMKAAADGLLPDGRESALVIYNSKDVAEKKIAQYMPMITGILKKVRNSGELATIMSQIVHKADKFRYWVDDDGEHVLHEPDFLSERGPRVGVYAMAKTKDDFFYFEFVTQSQIEDIRQSSRAKDSGPWAGKFVGEMWRKSALRRLSKRLPMSTDLEEVIRDDDNLGANFDAAKDVTPPVTKTVMEFMSEEVPEATAPAREPITTSSEQPSSKASPQTSVNTSSAPQAEHPAQPLTPPPQTQPLSSAPQVPPVTPGPSVEAKTFTQVRDEALDLMSFLGWTPDKFEGYCQEKYKKSPKNLSLEDCADLLEFLKSERERKTQ